MRLLHKIVYTVLLFLIVTGTISVVRANSALNNAATNPCMSALTWQQAATKAGSTVSVLGTVTSAHFAKWKNGKGSMTFLDMGAKYPSPNRFSIVVWNRDVSALGGKTVCARGAVTVYKGVPEMSVDTPSALVAR